MKFPIAGSIMKGYNVRKGRHEYEEGKPMVVEITFEGTSSSYVQVISIETARELAASLKHVLGQE
jgi:hypothetical protein